MSSGAAFPRRFLVLPWVFLFLGLALTYVLQNTSREAVRGALQDEFDFRVNELTGNIARRLQNYEQVLEGGAGLFAASNQVERKEFVDYVHALKLDGK